MITSALLAGGSNNRLNRKNPVVLSVLVLSAINLLNFYDRQAPGALVEPMRKEFHLSDKKMATTEAAGCRIDGVIGCHKGNSGTMFVRRTSSLIPMVA